MNTAELLILAEKCLGSQFNKDRWGLYLNDQPDKAKKQILDLASFMGIETTESTPSPEPASDSVKITKKVKK